MELTSTDFKTLRDFIHQKCGIYVDDSKEYLIRQRLEPIAKSYNLASFAELVSLIKTNKAQLEEEIIIAISTNETSFFRDKHPFETFSNYILPKLRDLIIKRKASPVPRKGAKVRIWSVASSTGQEPYSLAFLIQEFIEKGMSGVTYNDFSILATDINSEVLAKAIQGRYSDFELKRGLDQARINKYFTVKGGMYYVKPEIQEIIEFKKANLIHSLLSLGGFDLILCRNVLIYFDDTTKKRIVNDIYNMLSDDGIFMLGSSENLYNLTDKFTSTMIQGTMLFVKKT